MVDFSIKAVTAPFVHITNRCFDKITRYIVEKNPGALPLVVDHDLKVLMFDVATSLMVSTIALAYFKMIALVTAVALGVFFYLVRKVFAEAIVPVEIPKEKPGLLHDIKELTVALLPKGRASAPSEAQTKSIKERLNETFYQGDDVVIGSIVFLKMTHHPLPRMIGMIFTRS
jgi:energy-converting hydrogenase Eha subunit E